MITELNNHATTIKVYHGYGHQHNLVVYGHVLAGKPLLRKRYSRNPISNIIHIAKLFFITPIPNVRVMLQWQNQQLYSTTEVDGFFKFEWQSINFVPAGWHEIVVNLLDTKGDIAAFGQGKIFIPHSTQYAFISDIDDTVLISHSTKTGKRLKVLFTKNPRSRKTFADVVKYYHLLSLAHTEEGLQNPFFYVSSSEWNLYEDLNEFFKHNGLPKGAFLLNSIKRWYELFKTGKTKHQGKLMRVVRLLEAFPKQRFILLGDNSQKDPEIYAAISKKYADRIIAIYIRNIDNAKYVHTTEVLALITNKNIATCIFKHTDEAIAHSKAIGLIV
ncbi:MAG: App1 family protein [Pedobacter sp.]|nr:App1 family protein [Chitinophagaceae bacterium]